MTGSCMAPLGNLLSDFVFPGDLLKCVIGYHWSLEIRFEIPCFCFQSAMFLVVVGVNEIKQSALKLSYSYISWNFFK